MPDDNPQIVIGCRWVSEPGDCKICSALDGKEFYYHPREGQLSMDDMPRRRPHPNCRCHTEPIYGLDEVLDKMRKRDIQYDEWGKEIPETIEEKRARWKREYPSFNNASPELINKAEMEFGLFFKSDERGFFDGPAYGNYGGQKWTAGKNRGASRDNEIIPFDDMDAAFKDHDIGYDDCDESSDVETCRIGVDRRLVASLDNLKVERNNANMTIKTDKEMAYAERYRLAALWWFRGRMAVNESNYRDKEQGP
ncbi:MAG: hypothetical protein HY794_01840 [Desulfarculus sp.]|nr:hypothetical protein [Desulfarculus sp.]